MTVGDPASAYAHITLRNLIAARWVLVALTTAAVVLALLASDAIPAGLLPRSDFPLAIVVTLLVWALLNVAAMVALARQRASEPMAGAHLLVDAVALTILLVLSGGPANPFTIFYFLPITLATQVSPRWTWALAAMCLAGFASLFAVVGMAAPLGVAMASLLVDRIGAPSVLLAVGSTTVLVALVGGYLARRASDSP